MVHRLGYPNQEIRQSLNESLLTHLTGDPSKRAEHDPRLRDPPLPTWQAVSTDSGKIQFGRGG